MMLAMHFLYPRAFLQQPSNARGSYRMIILAMLLCYDIYEEFLLTAYRIAPQTEYIIIYLAIRNFHKIHICTRNHYPNSFLRKYLPVRLVLYFETCYSLLDMIYCNQETAVDKGSTIEQIQSCHIAYVEHLCSFTNIVRFRRPANRNKHFNLE